MMMIPVQYTLYMQLYKSQCMMMIPVQCTLYMQYKSQCMMMIPIHAKELGQKRLPVSLHDVRVIL